MKNLVFEWGPNCNLNNIPDLSAPNNININFNNDINMSIELEIEPAVKKEIKKSLVPQNPWRVKHVTYYDAEEKGIKKTYINIICEEGTLSFDAEKLPNNISANLILHSEVNFDCDENGDIIAIHFKQLGEK